MKRVPLVQLALDPLEVDATLAVIRPVLESGRFLLGPEVEAFETELAAAVGRVTAVGVGSGTDALAIGLRSLGVGPGDEVIVPAMTAFPTAAAVLLAGGTPVLADVSADRPLLDLDAALDLVSDRTAAVILVHLYGITADTAAFVDAFGRLGIPVVEDCAQAQGASLPTGEPVGSVGIFGAFSFYPTKNLGGLGDGGAIVTDDLALAREVRAWRSHGERGERYLHELPAGNSRLDDLHAAVLRLRLRDLPDRIARRRAVSGRYQEAFQGIVPYAMHEPGGAPHLAVVRVDDPTAVASGLDALGIGTGRHYPRALTDQPALHECPQGTSHEARAWASSCLSLPLYPALTNDEVDRVVDAVRTEAGAR